MDREAMQKDIANARKWNRVICFIFLAIAVCCILIICFFKYQRTFTQDKWHNGKEYRHKIVYNLLEKHQLVGMTESDVIELLGEEDAPGQTSFKMSRAYFPPETTLVYYLGVDYMDTNWLVISLENGIVVEYCIDVT